MITTLTLPIRALRCALSVLLLGLAVRASAAPVSFDIPAQAAAEALDRFIKQSGANVVYLQADVQGVSTNAVQGTYEPAAALKLLLQNTILTFTESKPGEFAVGRTKPGSVEGSVQSESGRPVLGARVALTGANQAVVTDKRGRFFFEEVPAGPQALAITAEGMQNTKVTDVNVKPGHRLTLSTIAIPVAVVGAVKLDDYVVSAKKNDGVVELDPFEVSGEKPKAFSTSSIDIVRTADDVLPFTVFSGKEIEEAGSASLSEFFRQRFSQLVTGVIHEENLIAGAANPDNPLRRLTPSKIGLVNGGGAESVLGSAEVVFLLNGRRIQNQTYGIDDVRGSAYFNGIPVASIERIEITTSSVSAIYGAGATGGVINIVTKNAYKGGFIRGTYETPSDTYAPTCTLDLSYATPLIRGWMCRVNYSYNRHIPLKLGDRADVTINRHRSNILAREPERLTLEGVPLGSTTNILVFTPDFSIDFVTSVPEGYSGASDAAPLLARKGMFNLALADGAASGQSGYGANSWLGARSENESFGLSFEGPLWKNWVALVEYSRRQAKFVGTPSPYLRSFNAFVSASSPINPFNQDVLVNFYDPRLDRPEFVRKHRNLTEEVVVSIRGTHGQWRSLVDYTSTRTKDSAFGVGFEPYSQAGSFWGNAYAAGTYNPFVDMRSVAPALPGFYTDYASDALGQGGKNRSHQITAKLSGPLWELPAGTTEATAGIEYNHWESMDQYWFNIRSRTTTGEVLFPTTIQAPTVPSESNSKSAYMEANMPLWDSRAKGIGLRRLEVFGSIRIERQELAEGNGLVDLDEF